MGEKGKEAGWKEISCLEEKLILAVPENWERIAAERVNRLFPYVHQPQEVIGDEEEEKLFTLNLLSQGLEEGQVNGAIREIQRAIQRVYPESGRQGIKRRRLKAGMAGWFSFSTGGEGEASLSVYSFFSGRNAAWQLSFSGQGGARGSECFPGDFTEDERRGGRRKQEGIKNKGDGLKESDSFNSGFVLMHKVPVMKRLPKQQNGRNYGRLSGV